MSNHPNPFSGPFAGAPGIGGNPLDDDRNSVICCPQCKSQNFNAFTNQYGIHRKCLEPGCKTEWSGGALTETAIARGLISEGLMPDGTVAPDIDIPSVQYTGAAFRDPSKSFGDDEW